MFRADIPGSIMAGKYQAIAAERGVDSDPSGWILQGTDKCDEPKPTETLKCIKIHRKHKIIRLYKMSCREVHRKEIQVSNYISCKEVHRKQIHISDYEVVIF